MDLKALFGILESYFHGKSSGLDPLVCYVNQPLLVATTTNIQQVKIPTDKEGKYTLFLLDTHIPRQTAPFVNGFLERCENPIYDKICSEQLVPKVDEAIASLLNNDWNSLYQAFFRISMFQFNYFDFMIPATFKEVWKMGLLSDHFKLKICGAGGGGYLLGISRDFPRTKKMLESFDVLRF